jgi:hypothetical protein
MVKVGKSTPRSKNVDLGVYPGLGRVFSAVREIDTVAEQTFAL